MKNRTREIIEKLEQQRRQYKRLKKLKKEADAKASEISKYNTLAREKYEHAKQFKNPVRTLETAETHAGNANNAFTTAQALYEECFEIIKPMDSSCYELNIEFYFSLFKDYAFLCSKSTYKENMRRASNFIQLAENFLHSFPEKFSGEQMFSKYNELEKIRSNLTYFPVVQAVKLSSLSNLICMNSIIFGTKQSNPFADIEESESYAKKRLHEEKNSKSFNNGERKHRKIDESLKDNSQIKRTVAPLVGTPSSIASKVPELSLNKKLISKTLEQQTEAEAEDLFKPIQATYSN